MALGTFLRAGALASFDVSALPSALTYLGAFAFVMVLGEPLLEEPGWRGFALPRQLHGPLIGASSWGACGRCGTCPGSRSRKCYRRQARSWTS
jgi:membrane protease YdiL (CAAX protease family)